MNPLRYPAFRFLVTGRAVTMLGNAVAPIALAFAVLDLTGSARDLGLVVGARSLTNVVFVLFGGVIADRMPRHLVMVGASLAGGGDPVRGGGERADRLGDDHAAGRALGGQRPGERGRAAGGLRRSSRRPCRPRSGSRPTRSAGWPSTPR